jgi:hypothetical protein
MSRTDKTIRVIKREQRQLAACQQEIPESELKTERQTRREMLETINSWIDELRERKKTASPILGF